MILIDTNVYSASNAGNSVAINIMKRSDNILIPAVVIGELKAGFLGGNIADLNNQVLDRFMSDNRVEPVDISLKTASYYAELSNFCKKLGRVLSNNDLWIAAIAQENDCKLVTYDRDFEVFSDLFAENLLILS